MPLPENPPTGILPIEPPAHYPEEFAEFWTLWRAEKFWACHEALEDVWRAETSPEKRRFLQGIIHLAVAVFQHRRGNAKGAARQMVRAKTRLQPYMPEFEGLDIAAMIKGVTNEISASLAIEHEGLSELEATLRAKLGD